MKSLHLARHHELKPIRMGNRLFFSFEDVKAYLREYQQQQDRISEIENALKDIQNVIADILEGEEDKE